MGILRWIGEIFFGGAAVASINLTQIPREVEQLSDYHMLQMEQRMQQLGATKSHGTRFYWEPLEREYRWCDRCNAWFSTDNAGTPWCQVCRS